MHTPAPRNARAGYAERPRLDNQTGLVSNRDDKPFVIISATTSTENDECRTQEINLYFRTPRGAQGRRKGQ